jgi:hypothetical protein
LLDVEEQRPDSTGQRLQRNLYFQWLGGFKKDDRLPGLPAHEEVRGS